MGCRLPGGINSPGTFWELLRQGRSAIREVPPERWDLAGHYNADPQTPLHQHVRHGGFVDGIDQFDAAFFGITPREAICMDPQQRLMLEVAWQAIENGGQPLERLRGQRVGVFIGISSSDYSNLLWLSPERYLIPDNEPFVLPGNTGCIAANRLSYFFDFKGPSFTIDTACSSSLVAVHLACESLWQGESTAALVGGVQALINPGIQMSFCKAGLLAPDGRCKSFDAAADGYVRSEGAGAVLLKPLGAAQADGDPIVAVIHGTAVNSDGRSNGMVAPNLKAQVACVREAFGRAGIPPAATQYVEAHGTGTRQGDPIELRALGTVLGDGRPDQQPCRVGSVKTNLGHSETAAGITGLIKAALCIQHRQLPPSLNFRTPNPAIDFQGLGLQVQTALEPFPQPDRPAVVGVSSFGFGGTNAHVVLADAPVPRHRSGPRPPHHLLCLSARSDAALRQQAADLAALLEARPALSLNDLCATANSRRSHFNRRLVCLGSDRTTLLTQLQAAAAGHRPAGAVLGQASRRPGKLAMLFTGQGSQALGMARGLYDSHPVVREAFDRCAALLDPLLPQPLATVLYPPAGQEEQAAMLLADTAITQPALFVVGYALSALWRSWGVEADLLLGHSVGEIVAAHLAGVFNLEDALTLVAARGRLMQALPAEGAMVAVLAAADQVQSLLDDHPSLVIAAFNGPANTVVSGPRAAMAALEAQLTARGLGYQPLAVRQAFHSPAMAPMLEAFADVLTQLHFSPPQRPLVSNVSGLLAGPEVAQAEYWCEHVLAPVRFAQGMATLAAQGASTMLELGARPTLIGMGRQCLPEGDRLWCPSLRPGQDDWAVMHRSLAELHGRGYRIDWSGVHAPFPHRPLVLPGYPFQRQRYWWPRPEDSASGASLWQAHLGLVAPAQPALAAADPLRAVPAAAPPDASAMPTPAAPTPPLQGEPNPQLQPLALPGGQERRYAIQLGAAAPAELADHRLRQQVVLPAAGFLTLALEVLQQQDLPLALEGWQLEQPLRLPAGAGLVDLQVVLGPRGLEFHSQRREETSGAGGAAATWLEHGRATLGPTAAPAEAAGSTADRPGTTANNRPEQPFAASPVPTGATPLDLAAFYQALERYGLAYGPAFRPLQQLHRQGERAWAVLQRQGDARDWTLLDGCFQAVAATLDPEASAGQLFLPVGLEAMALEALPLPDRLHCQVQLCPSPEPAFVEAHLLLLSEAGAELGWIRGFRLRRLPRAALDWLFPLEEPSPVAADLGLVQGQWEPLTPAAATNNTPQPPAPVVAASSLGPTAEAAAAALLAMAQQPEPSPLWLLLDRPDAPELQGVLAGLARTAALEQPQRQWLQLALQGDASAATVPWGQVAALADQEATLAWDGQRLWGQRLRPLPPERSRTVSLASGELERLEEQPLGPLMPGPGEVELAVEATGLNFRDVLNALGLLKAYGRQLGLDEQAQVPFGGEAVGRVVAVGEGVDPALRGQRLIAALAVGSLASHVLCRAELCVPLPATLSVEEGAAVSTAFLTALYGLQTLARLQPGDTVLIHAAAGGVGQAALQVAQRVGARVLATASRSKQAALLEQGVEAVFDSRSLTFADAVLAHTGGRGVDVVLNSLKDEWVEAGFRALAPGGRFVELGKIGIWSRQQAAERRPDATYLPFDLLEVAAAEPALVRGLLEQLLADLEAGVLRVPPLQVFEASGRGVVDAFRLMAQGRHVGKVVIRRATSGTAADPVAAAEAFRGTVLVSGGLGGVGLRLLPWLVERGARGLLLLGRQADRPSAEAQALLAELEGRGVTCTRLALNLAAPEAAAGPVEEQLAAALEALAPDRPLTAVVHAAGVLDDGLIHAQTPERLAAVLAPKLGGWRRIVAAINRARGVTPPALVLHFSSVASLLGSPGQSSYSAANGALDWLAEAAASWPGCRQLAIQWGPWADAGMAARLGEREQQRLQALGLTPLTPERALQALDQLLARHLSGSVAVLEADWDRLARQARGPQATLLAPLAAAQQAAHTHGGAPGPAGTPPPYRAVLAATPELERHGVLVQFLQQQLATVMGMADAAQIDPSEPLFALGLDSLMALELMVLLENNLGVRLTESLVFEHPTVEDLARYFLAEVLVDASPKEPSATAPAMPDTAPPDPAAPTTTTTPAEPGRWEQEVASVAALDTASLLRQLRGS